MLSSALFTWPAGHVVTALELNEAVAALNGSADVAVINLANPTPNPAAISGTVLSQNGNLNGAYQWVLTETVGLVDGNGNLHPGGQTASGTPSNLVNPSNNPVALSLPAPTAQSISRTIWRTTAGGTTFYFLVTLTNPQVSTWIDDVADADLGTETAPTVNNTGTVLSLPVFDSVPAFSVEAGTLIAVTNADNATTLYRSDGSGWLALPDLAVANTWTAAQTFESATLTGTTTNAGTISGGTISGATLAGTTELTGPILSYGSPGQYLGPNLNIHYPTTGGGFNWYVNVSGTHVLQVNADGSNSVHTVKNTLDDGSGNAAIAGLATFNAGITGTGTLGALTAGTGLLETANTWTAAQTFESATLTGTTTNAGTISGGTVNPASGAVAGLWTAGGFPVVTQINNTTVTVTTTAPTTITTIPVDGGIYLIQAFLLHLANGTNGQLASLKVSCNWSGYYEYISILNLNSGSLTILNGSTTVDNSYYVGTVPMSISTAGGAGSSIAIIYQDPGGTPNDIIQVIVYHIST